MRFRLGVILVACQCLLFSIKGYTQRLMGVVMHHNEKGADEPLSGANIHWAGTSINTVTRVNGVFLIDRVEGIQQLVISFVGYQPDTLQIEQQTNVKVTLIPTTELKEVTVEGWRPTSRVSYASGIHTIEMTEKELFKAACCNLSESFETNPSVDVAFTDAITGTRQIQMLGLSGPNTMISIENMPGVRGLASSQGIQFIPGPWINSIQVTKGIGSVINGYESIAGQINVELKKPQESDKLYVNGYLNNSGRAEANVIYTFQTSKKWGTTFLLHGSARPLEMDQNRDSFLDFPKGNQINFINRWIYHSGSGWLGQFSLKYIRDQKQGGQTGFVAEQDKFTNNRYGFEINTDRYEFTGKLGYQFKNKPYKSAGLQISAVDHAHDSYFGFRTYVAKEQSFYANWIYQSILGNTFHKFKSGLSFLYDQYTEDLNSATTELIPQRFIFARKEIVPGAFAEYAYDDLKKFSLIAGLRVDHHNLFGLLVVPRLHLRYDLTPSTTVRASAGRGIRVANIISENSGFLASSRAVVLSNQQTTLAYGFRPDKAWNAGANLSQEFTLDYRQGILSVDYFFTNFQNQVIVDFDKNPQQINFYALNGKSFSHSVQVQVDYQLVRRLDLRIAYRWLDVRTDYSGGQLQRPLIPRDRAFVNLAYSTKSRWQFDVTLQRIGRQRIPSTETNPQGYQLDAVASPYLIVNAQITKELGTLWSVYVGGENLSNFRVKNPIISAADPFSAYFDSSLSWGPVFGRMIYGGFRYRIK